MKKTLLHHLANEQFRLSGNRIDIAKNARENIESLCRDFMPRGSGFDSGTQFDFDKSKSNRLVFNTEFHHMNSNGYYDGWTSHNVTIKPDLVFGFTIAISGRDRNEIKDYIADAFHHALSSELEAQWDKENRAMIYIAA